MAWAQTGCPASPNYLPDFSFNQNCLTLNGTNPQFLATSELGPVVLRLTPNTGNQVASAWFNSPQFVQNGFSTNFQFQFTGASAPPADGIAFVIQNSSTAAIGYAAGNGGALGYGDGDASTNPSTGAGIPNSLAIEFDVFQNSWDPAFDGAGHVAVQSCGTGPNTSHHNQLCLGDGGPNSTLGAPVSTPSLTDGLVHSVTVTYTPPVSGCPVACLGSLHVILDNVDLYPSGVSVDLNSIGLGEGGSAYVGFTGATGADVENQDILNWTYTAQSQSGVVTTQTPTVFNFQGGVQNGGYDYNAQLTSGSPVTAQVTAIPITDQATCNTIVQANPLFNGAQCFVYQNASGANTKAPVMFELTCPGSPGGTCGSDSLPNFLAELGTDFNFAVADNPGFMKTNPTPGWLKGVGPDPLHPCTQNPGNNPPLFQSNQIDSFSVVGDPVGKAKGGSGGTGSCWMLTYNTPHEAPSVNIVAPANGGTYQQGQATQANYTCTTVNNASGATGPYLTPASCSASDNPGGTVAQGTQFDTATLGSHTFTATVVDSAGDSASQAVTYNVVGAADVAILKLAPPRASTGSKLTYGIGVADFGPSTAVNVNVNDPLPSGTAFVSASGSNLACSIVRGRLSCSVIAVPCLNVSGTVSCAVGTLMPLSISSLNGAIIQIAVQVTAAAGTTKNPTVLKNTATVSAGNTDPNPNNNSSTATTLVTSKGGH